ncbi:class I SAM-dependent methyltransferase [uncultured Desulfobulbus sp.]|uniref:class I SAM-dependent methyltransferase n=1 Tax=uncultured Desulfobulbus sp. TaxID=239745 RepID=UPI0029C81DAF|nr:class I SAM-dependent methyltransferase [uncultured Desulfobulbus sp.]
MEENCPSKTALRVALRRAAHQLLDEPKIFDDPLAVRLLGLDATGTFSEYGQEWLAETPLSRVLRASLAARSQYLEDEFRVAREQGVGQLVILGAGLDTFAYRNPGLNNGLRVFEVDHPATQQWKHKRLEEANILVPPNLTFAPIDFETQTLPDGLGKAGFAFDKKTFFSWLGVSMYLSSSAIEATLRFVASLPAGCSIVFDYMIPPSMLSPNARNIFDGLAQRVAAAGEPFQTFFEPLLLERNLREMGFGQVVDMAPEKMDARYFKGRTDGLRVGKLSHIMHARV